MEYLAGTLYVYRIKRWFPEDDCYIYSHDKSKLEQNRNRIIEALQYGYEKYQERTIALQSAVKPVGICCIAKDSQIKTDKDGRKYMPPVRASDEHLWLGGYLEVLEEIRE